MKRIALLPVASRAVECFSHNDFLLLQFDLNLSSLKL